MANMNFGVNILPKANNTYTLGNSDYKWNIFANTLNGVSLTNIITDIQIDGTSIINNGIANIPIMSNNTFGTAKINGTFGINISNSGVLTTHRAQLSEIKEASGVYRPITPDYQHYSVFYGLAKVAGDSTQSASSNAVGIYTDSAKVAIGEMLGYDARPWELIREDTFTNVEEADHIITTDSNNEAFSLTDIVFLFETPKSTTTAAAKGSYGQVWFDYENSNRITTESGAWTQDIDGSAHGFAVKITQEPGGLIDAQATTQTTSSNAGNWRGRFIGGFTGAGQGLKLLNSTAHFTKITIPTVTGTGHYILIGKRTTT